MLRKPLNPEEQATANRWLLVNLAGYLSIALITVLLVTLSVNSRNGGGMQAQTSATEPAHMGSVNR